MPSPDPTSADRAALARRGLRLEYATLAWNVIGVGVVASAAWRARSVALAGFGLDSLIEIFASVVVVWQLTAHGAPAAVARQRHSFRASIGRPYSPCRSS